MKIKNYIETIETTETVKKGDNMTDLYRCEDGAEIRIHISIVNRELYIFTSKMLEETKSEFCFFEREVETEDGITATGICIPIELIKGLKKCKISKDIWNTYDSNATTSLKGRFAVEVVKAYCDEHKIKFEEAMDIKNQINGIDGWMTWDNGKRYTVQIKLDEKSGNWPGTGNLFIQTFERNPNKNF